MKNLPQIKIISQKTLSNNFYTLERYDFEYLRNDGSWQAQHREVYDCGDGAGILLYNLQNETIILIRQFRMPISLNGHDGMLIEVPAGVLDGADPLKRIIAETEEEAGYKITSAQKIMETFVCPGAVKQRLHLFIAEYDANNKISNGGGLIDEGEEIEVLEIPFKQAWEMFQTGEILDAKTILLLQYAALNIFKK